MTMGASDRRKLKKLSKWWHLNESASARQAVIRAYESERQARKLKPMELKRHMTEEELRAAISGKPAAFQNVSAPNEENK